MRAQAHKPIVIAAGGTGGHFFPAEALAAELLERGERVVLLTDTRSSAGKSPVFQNCETHVVPGGGIAGRSLRRALAGAFAITRGVAAARRILAAVQPGVVVGFGGYPSVAPLLAARLLMPRPVLILHDQNAVLGKANQFLARFCDYIALSYPRTGGVPAGRKTVFTGNPVRPAILAHAASAYTPPGEGPVRLTVLGGSLGARVFATLIPAALAALPVALRARIMLTMQCPAAEIETARAALAGAGIAATLSPFFENVAALLVESHLVIARSGGSTVAELAVIGRPAIFIPLTINADQRANADALAANGAALRLDQAGLPPETLAKEIETFLMNPERLTKAAEASAKLGAPRAAARLADLVQERVAA